MAAKLWAFALVFSAIVAALPSVEGATKVTGAPISSAIVLDGDPGDWQGLPVVNLQESLHLVSIAHDDQSLYLMFRFADEHLARQLMVHGVTLWIDGDGKKTKKKERFAVRYPGSTQISEHLASEGEGHGNGPPEGSPPASRNGSPPQDLKNLRQVPGTLTVIRMGVKETGDESDPEGPGAGSRFADGQYCYELRIPFADIGGAVQSKDPSKKRKIAVGIEIGGLTETETEMLQSLRPENTGGPGGPGGVGPGRPGGGMGGMPPAGSGMGGGPPGGMEGGPAGGRRPGVESDILWLTVTLSEAS